jgi:hypothetical protein
MHHAGVTRARFARIKCVGADFRPASKFTGRSLCNPSHILRPQPPPKRWREIMKPCIAGHFRPFIAISALHQKIDRERP